jgi:hypothetical protein
MGNRQVDTATMSKFSETFRVCRVFFAHHFGNKIFRVRFYFHKDAGQDVAKTSNIRSILLENNLEGLISKFGTEKNQFLLGGRFHDLTTPVLYSFKLISSAV